MSLNAVLGKISNASPSVLVALIESTCVQILLFACECVQWKNCMFSSMERAYNQIYQKIFKSFDNKIIEQCMFYMGQLPIELKIVKRRIHFLFALRKSSNTLLKVLQKTDNDYCDLCNKYKLHTDFKNLDSVLWNYFKNNIK